MPERTSYTQGTPNWVDLQTSDPEAAKVFYGEMFDWDFDDQPMPDGPTYSMATVDGHHIAAIAPQPPDMKTAGAPAMWNTYLAVDSVDDAVAKVAAAGGQVAMPPMDVMDAGRMAYVMDPSGAGVCLWQANTHIGASLVNEPGTVIWNELITTDPSAPAFYERVVGLTTSTMDMGGGDEYTLFHAGDAQVGGSTAPQAPGIPNHWHVYFAVEDVDEAAAKAAKLGGAVITEPFDTPVGRMATICDPQGATFTVMQPSAPDS
ncbi:MAG TPA: VOC family protein [Streptosporangiaceae bacterium]|nr:VOC family protein [Streptosporangiaceae bacterium]